MKFNLSKQYLTRAIQLTVFCLPLLVLANDAYLGSEGGNIFPQYSNDIQMVREEIRVTLYQDSCNTECTFWFYNDGPAKTIHMGFPNYYEWPAEATDSLRNFTCTIQDSLIQAQHQILTESFPDTTEIMHFEKWFTWWVDMPTNDTIIIKNSYTGNYGGSVDGSCNVSYVIGTGKTWQKPIGKGRVVFDLSHIASTLFLSPSSYPDQNLPKEIQMTEFKDSVVYNFENYHPAWKDKMAVRLLPYWKSSIYGDGLIQEDMLMDTFQRNSLSKKQALLMKNEILARHGFVFKDNKDIQAEFEKTSWYNPNPQVTIKNLPLHASVFIKVLSQIK